MTKLSAALIKIVRSGFSSAEEIVFEKNFDSGVNSLQMKDADLSSGDYQLRLENTEGVPVERQVWFSVADKE